MNNLPFLIVPEEVDKQLKIQAKIDSPTRQKSRHEKYRLIYSAIFYKAEDGFKLWHKFYSNYWIKVLGTNYSNYVNSLLKARIIQKEGKYYSLDYNFYFKHAASNPSLKILDTTNEVEQNNRIFKKVSNAYQCLEFHYDDYLEDLNAGLMISNLEHIDLTSIPEQVEFKVKYFGASGVYKSKGDKLKKLIEDKEIDIQNVIFSKGKLHLYPEFNFLSLKRVALRDNASIVEHYLDTPNKTYFSIDKEKTGRVFTSITGVSSSALPYFKLDGEPLIGLDFKNSQYAIFANLLFHLAEGYNVQSNFGRQRGNQLFIKKLKDILNNLNNTDDIHQFYADIIDGDFYSELGSLLGIKYRSIVKNLAFVFLFSKPSSKQPFFEQKFESRYPAVNSIIQKYKKENCYKSFSTSLQSIEAEIVFDKLYHKITKHNKIKALTRHDSIIVKSSNAHIVNQITTEELQKLNIKINLEEEDYSKIYN